MDRRWVLNDDECVSGGMVLAVKGCCSLRHVLKGGTDETAKQLTHVKFPTSFPVGRTSSHLASPPHRSHPELPPVADVYHED